MKKAVLISIKPKWCEIIASGKRTIEVRKTRPKLETPFKCYIYCTSGNYRKPSEKLKSGDFWIGKPINDVSPGRYFGNGRVIGEFVCDTYVIDKTFGHDDLFNGAACLSEKEAVAYSANKILYGWHITELKIYDQPKELRCFYRYLPEKILKSGDHDCRIDGDTLCIDAPEGGGYCEECKFGGRIYLTKAPQSWCYVEALI